MISTQCSHDDRAEIDPAIVSRLSLSFPEAYQYAEPMALLSLAVKEQEDASFCVLPFCHTVEGEALGGHVIYSDTSSFPRPGTRIYSRAETLLELPSIDFTSGRIRQVLDACKLLAQKKERVMLNMAGPLTILNLLMDTSDVFRLLYKDSSLLETILYNLKRELLRYTALAKEAGVALISYADPIAAEDMIGPKLSSKLTELFTLPFLRELEALLSTGETSTDHNSMSVLLCPKASLPLISSGKVRLEPQRDAEQTSPGETPSSHILTGVCVKKMIRQISGCQMVYIENHENHFTQ